MACGDGETEIPDDSVVRIGEVKATLPASGIAVLRLCLFGEDATAYNEYQLRIRC
jgi:hypothetical protein